MIVRNMEIDGLVDKAVESASPTRAWQWLQPAVNHGVKCVKVVYNEPSATIAYWSDGTKTVVRCHEGDAYDRREGFLLCCAKKLLGNTGAYNDAMREHCPERHDPRAMVEGALKCL